jgi:hypothetical protein
VRFFRSAIDDEAIDKEIIVLCRNVPIMTGRDIRMQEAGMALGVFLYWYLGFQVLSPSERRNSTRFNMIFDCRWSLSVMLRRMIAAGMPSPVPNLDLLDSYIAQQIADVPSFLGCVDQCSHIFAESYLVTTDQWPTNSSWEQMPALAACSKKDFCEVVHRKIASFCSEPNAEAILPMDVVRSTDGLEMYGENLAKGFRARA